MFIYLLFIAAMLFFISDRKVRLAILPGLAIILTLSYWLCWKMVYEENGRLRSTIIQPKGIPFLWSYIIASAALTIVIGTTIAYIFLLLGRLISKPMFKASGETGRNMKTARILFLIASIITAAAGFFQICFAFTSGRIRATTVKTLERITIALGRLGKIKQTTCIYGLIFLCIGIVCLILALTCKKIYRNLASVTVPKKNTFLTVGIIISAVGNLGIGIIAAVGLIIWRKIFLFNGYGYTKVLCLTCMLLMAAGLILILIGFAKTNVKKSVVKIILAISLIIVTEFDLLFLSVKAMEGILKIYF